MALVGTSVSLTSQTVWLIKSMVVDLGRMVTFTVQSRTSYSWFWNFRIFKFIVPLLASA